MMEMRGREKEKYVSDIVKESKKYREKSKSEKREAHTL